MAGSADSVRFGAKQSRPLSTARTRRVLSEPCLWIQIWKRKFKTSSQSVSLASNQLMEIFDYLQIICIKCMWIKKDRKKIDLSTNILKRILPVLWVTKIDECKFQQFQEIKQGIPIILKLKVLLGNSNIFFFLSTSISRLFVMLMPLTLV